MDSAESEDWRLGMLDPLLSGLTFYRAMYKAPSPHWDHDHCNGCNAKFMEQDYPEVLHEGYVTDEQGGRWLCETCFQDFRERFGWKLRPKEASGPIPPLAE